MEELEELVDLLELDVLLEELELVLLEEEVEVLLLDVLLLLEEDPCVDQYAEVSLVELLGTLAFGAALVTASTFVELPKDPPPPLRVVPLELV